MSRRKSNTPLAWQKSREPSFTKSNPDSRPISQEGQKNSTGGSRRNSVLSLLPKTPPGSRRYSITPDRDSNTVNEEEYKTGDEEKGADVASKATFKVSRFLDYYNEALRRRFERELMKPTTVPKAGEESTTEPLTSEYEDTFGEEPVGKAAAYWKKVLAKTTAVTKIAEPVKTRKISIPSHALSQIQKRKAVKNVQKLLRRMEVRRKFRKKTRIIIFCIRCVKNHSFKFRERSELTPYMNTLNYIDYRNDQVKDLMFDRSQFSANRQMRISEETKRILSKRKSDRTDNEVYSAQIALRNIRSFAELPVRMQQMIARAGQYESYESQRVITRENHPPSAFYFILSGAAVAMKMDPERPDIAIPIKEYVKGDNFEESPLLNDTTREVTILTKEQCEFLSISSADYREIFMAGGVKNLNDPDMEMFLKSLHFLNGWPIQLLQENPKECRFHYFKRGVVLAEDSRKSPWLIIVKSGSISVMKKLRKVGPFEWRKNNGLKPLTEKESRERMHERQQWRRYVLPELRITLRKQNDFEEIEERVDGKPKPFQHPDIKVHLEDSESSDKKGKKYYYPNLWAYSATDDADKGTTFSNINKQYLYTISSSSHTAKDGRGQHRKSGTAIVKPPATAPLPERPRGLSESRNIPSPTHSEVSQISLRSLLTSSVDSEDSVRTPSSVFDERIKTIAAGVRSGGEPLSEIDLNPEFVNIQTLIKGDVWGIADLMLEGQPSFIVISNGADCVLISKNFYKLHCTEKLQRQLKHELCPYPSDNELQESLQVSVDWDEHKRCEVTSTIDRVRNQKCLRDIPINCKVVETVK